MRKECIQADPTGGLSNEFALWEIAGSWVSTQDSTGLRIFRNRERKNGGILLELRYATGTVCRRRPNLYFGSWCIDFFGLAELSYDRGKDLLYLSGYGFYRRAD